MGKKRKAGKGPFARSGNDSSRLNSNLVTKYDQNETFPDSEDEFFAGRDEILLEEQPAQKRRRELNQEDLFLHPSDEEVLGYYDEDEEEDEGGSDDDDANAEDLDEDGGRRRPVEDEHTSTRDWGTSKADYYDADVIETEQDALDEQEEAIRLQKQQLEDVEDIDHGFDEAQWAAREAEEDEAGTIWTQKLPEWEIPEGLPADERLKLLKSRYPEFEILAQDFVTLQSVQQELRAQALAAIAARKPPKRVKDTEMTDDSNPPFAVTRWRSLTSYLGSIAMYLTILTSKQPRLMPLNELAGHGVMDSLLQSRKVWEAIKDMPVPKVIQDDQPFEDLAKTSQAQTDQLQREVTEAAHKLKKAKPKKEKVKTSASRVDALQATAAETKPKKRKRNQDVESNVKDIETLIAEVKAQSKQKAVPVNGDNNSDFGDEGPLTATETAEKAQRKKGLRFYTSQLAQKSNKRDAASRDAGGDADLPYKERLKDRQTRLMREAEKRGREKDDLEAADDGNAQEDDRIAKEVRGEEDDVYYQTILSKTSAKKADREALKLARAEAARQGPDHQVVVEAKVGKDGKRAITYEIAKNKGLTPKRSKDVRNPRVKKRKKYDEKMKKLGSMKQVYKKDGEGRGGYGGELTGIKTDIVRSVKL